MDGSIAAFDFSHDGKVSLLMDLHGLCFAYVSPSCKRLLRVFRYGEEYTMAGSVWYAFRVPIFTAAAPCTTRRFVLASTGSVRGLLKKLCYQNASF